MTNQVEWRGAGVALDYDVTVNGPVKLREKRKNGLFDVATARRITCRIGDELIQIMHGDHVEVSREIASGRVTVVDRKRERFGIIEPASDQPRAATLVARRTGATRMQAYGERERRLEEWHIAIGERRVEAWVIAQPLLRPEATATLWRLLLAGCPDELAFAGVPADLLVRDGANPERLVGRVRLASVGAAAAPRAELPARFERISLSHTARSEKRRLQPASTEASEPSVALRTLSATAPTDAAWTTTQAAFDQAAGIVNTVAQAFTAFTDGTRVPAGELGLVIDWWQQLEPWLAFSGAADAERTAIGKLSAAYKVLQGDEPLGLDDATDRARYQMVVLGPLEDWEVTLGVEQARLLRFFSTNLDAGTRDRVIAAEVAALTKPIVFSTGLAKLDRNVGPGETIHLHLHRFRETTARVAHPLVQVFRPERDRVRLVVGLDEVSTRFHWDTTPSGNTESILCQIFTFGLCGLAVTGWGTGSLSLSNIELAFDVRRRTRRGVPIGGRYRDFELAVELNRGASSMNVEWSLGSVNFIEELALLVFDAFNAFSEPISDAILGAIADEVKGVSLRSLFRWPTLWHATGGPPIVGTALTFLEGSGTLLAELANAVNLPPAGHGDPAAAALEPMGYSVSRRYLAAWLRERVGPYDATVEPTFDWNRAFGVKLVEPQTFNRPSPPPTREPGHREPPRPSTDEAAARALDRLDGCDDLPRIAGDSYRYRTSLVRSALDVTLPDAGPAATAGRVKLEYTLRLDAVRSTIVNRREVVPIERCVDVTQTTEGLPLHAHLEGMRERVLERVATSGMPCDTTPGRLALQAETIERTRAAHAILDGVIVDPPRDPQPGRPERPERPGLPSRICEPPHCEWFSGVSEAVVATPLEARVTVTADLAIGFDPGGSFWLPQLALGAVNRTVAVTELHVTGQLTRIERATLTRALEQLLERDAAALLHALATKPLARRTLLPAGTDMVTGISAEIIDIVTFEQARPAELPYVVQDELVSWPIRVVEQLSSHIRPPGTH